MGTIGKKGDRLNTKQLLIALVLVVASLVFVRDTLALHTSNMTLNETNATALLPNHDINISVNNSDPASNITEFNITNPGFPNINISSLESADDLINCTQNASLVNCSSDIPAGGEVSLVVNLTAGADGSYTFTLTSVDNDTASSDATDRTFTMDSTAPTLYNVSNETSDTLSTIYWNLSESGNCSLSWGTTEALGETNASDALTTTCSQDATGLSASTLYYYNVTSCDAFGLCNTTGPDTFTTADTPPVSLAFALAFPSTGCTEGKGSTDAGGTCDLCYFEPSDLTGDSDDTNVSCEGQTPTTSFVAIDSQTTTTLNFTMWINESLASMFDLKASQLADGWETACSGDPVSGCVNINSTTPIKIITGVTNTTDTEPYDAQLWLFADFIAATQADTRNYTATINSSQG